jgi:hypothetical protein
VRLQFFPHSIHVLLYMVYGLVRQYIEPPFVEGQRRSSSCAIPGVLISVGDIVPYS